ncbi:2-hydroxyacid dehydrogenase [Siculibacillus lacustris]|uniref:2-hydroxyacid dehydrogenase n=1 Tax=Siculibacillus lacustris TaxID=1549641 RepID=A0A4Q9VL00_9HYPH|nr:2-hydroxyacid dehydrogenase [Siculibacillus lacustris]TBW36132.1 2-hydroxyacid dehydrogenase [Siculibacillus lacustris]
MKPEILMLEPMMAEIEAALDAAYVVHRLHRAPDRAAMIAAVAPTVTAIVTGGATGAPADLVAALPRLGIVAINGVGTDAVDLVDARARGIRVTTTPGVLTDDVADMALGLTLSVLRRLAQGDRFVRAGSWPQSGFPLGRKATGRRLGIVGLGRIGRAVAERARGFRMDIAYTDLAPVAEAPGRFVGDLVELARWSEVLVVCSTGGPGTRGLIGRAVIDALGPEGVLINVARGSVVDEPELVAALVEGRLGGAGLDVFADEPRVPAALLDLPGVVLEPHQASATRETRLEMGSVVVRSLAAFYAGEDLPAAVV